MRGEDTVGDLFSSHRPKYQTPEEILRIFVEIANKVLEPMSVGGQRRELKVSDIKHEPMYNNIGMISFDGNGYFATLQINHLWWETVPVEARLSLIVHEVTHIEDTSHSPSFWNKFVENYRECRDKYAFIDSLFRDQIEWKRADWFCITMPDNPTVDFSHECPPQRWRKIADSLGYTEDFDEFEVLEGQIEVAEYSDTELVKLSEIECQVPSDYEIGNSLLRMLREDRDISYSVSSYVLESPILYPQEEVYRVVRGKERVQLLKRTLGKYQDDPEIPVRISEASEPG